MRMVTVARASLVVTAVAASMTIGVAGPALATTPGWHVSLHLSGPNGPVFSAVTATSASSAWAFENRGSLGPAAYRLNRSAWRRQPFPAKAGDIVTAASASSASNVWAFTFEGQVLRFNGTRWARVKTLGAPIASGLAISTSDVWVFAAPGGGTWRYNGRTWTRSRSGSGLMGASALSATSIWGFGGTNVAHWNGRSCRRTNLAGLLPPKTLLSQSRIAGIDAFSASNVYAVASGGREDEGGPLVVLHYNGHVWRRVAEDKSLGDPIAVVGDGHGGLWIPVGTGPAGSRMEHFSRGRLSSARLPFSPLHLILFGAAVGPRTTAALAVGGTHPLSSVNALSAVILRFGP